MNFKISKKQINDVMNRISKIFTATTVLPVYKGIKITADDTGINIIVSDGTVSMQEFTDTDLEVYENGECVVDGRLFFEIVKKAANGLIWVRKEGKLLKLKSEKAEMKLVIFADDQYPSINFSFPEAHFSVAASALENAIDKTIFSASDQQTRPVLGGLNFNITKCKCMITGSDSYRLSQMVIPVISELECILTIPKKMLALFTSIFTGDDELYVYFNERKALISNKNVILQSVLLEGSFPDTGKLIPDRFETTLTLETDKLFSALDRTAFNKEDGVTIVGIELLTDELLITSESRAVGSSVESIEYIRVEGNQQVCFHCNQQYMLEALKALSSKTCTLHYNADNKPFIFRPDGDEGHLQLLLPVRHR